MASYLFLVVILLFGSSMLLAASYDFLGLGPSQTSSRSATMMNQAQTERRAASTTMWWCVHPAGGGADR